MQPVLRLVPAPAVERAIERPERLRRRPSGREMVSGSPHDPAELVQGCHHPAPGALPVQLVLRLVVAGPQETVQRVKRRHDLDNSRGAA